MVEGGEAAGWVPIWKRWGLRPLDGKGRRDEIFVAASALFVCVSERHTKTLSQWMIAFSVQVRPIDVVPGHGTKVCTACQDNQVRQLLWRSRMVAPVGVGWQAYSRGRDERLSFLDHRAGDRVRGRSSGLLRDIRPRLRPELTPGTRAHSPLRCSHGCERANAGLVGRCSTISSATAASR